jgi:hypothetical protein
MWYENLNYLIKEHGLEFPINIKIDGNHCFVYDERIPQSYYNSDSLTTCTPDRFKTVHQHLQDMINEDCGAREVKDQFVRHDLKARKTIDVYERKNHIKHTVTFDKESTTYVSKNIKPFLTDSEIKIFGER